MSILNIDPLLGKEISSRILDNETEEVVVLILSTPDVRIKQNIEITFLMLKEHKYMNNTYSNVTIIINPLNSNLFRDIGYTINNDYSLNLDYFDNNNNNNKQIPNYPLSVWFFLIRNSLKNNNIDNINMVSFLIKKELNIKLLNNNIGLKENKNNKSINNINFIAGVGRTRGKRPYMEDVDFIYQNIEVNKKQIVSLFGVLDGHGGDECARYVGDEMPMKITSFMKNGNKPEQALHNSFLDIDKDFLKGYSNAGSTANCLLFDHKTNTLYIANTGDTRAVLCRSGKAIDITMDRKATDPEEIARIIKEGGFVTKGRVMGSLAVSRAIGDSQLKNISRKGRILIPDPEITKYKPKMCIIDNHLYPDDICMDEFIIIATDGLWDVLSSQSAVDYVRDNMKKNNLLSNDENDNKTITGLLSKIANNIADHAVTIGSQDNVTVMIIKITGLDLENGYCDDDDDDEDMEDLKEDMSNLTTSKTLSIVSNSSVFNKLPLKSDIKSDNNNNNNNNNNNKAKNKIDDDDDMMDFLLDDSNF